MTTDEAREYLAARLPFVCDKLGNGVKPTWTLQDLWAMKALMREREDRDLPNAAAVERAAR